MKPKFTVGNQVHGLYSMGTVIEIVDAENIRIRWGDGSTSIWNVDRFKKAVPPDPLTIFRAAARVLEAATKRQQEAANAAMEARNDVAKAERAYEQAREAMIAHILRSAETENSKELQ